jgi:hypothetical protein
MQSARRDHKLCQVINGLRKDRLEKGGPECGHLFITKFPFHVGICWTACFQDVESHRNGESSGETEATSYTCKI